MIKLRSSLSPYAVANMTEAEFRGFIKAAKAGDYDHFYEEEELVIEAGSLSSQFMADVKVVVKAKNYNVELDDGGALTWEEQQILKEGYTCDL